jgi:hypothetical protein
MTQICLVGWILQMLETGLDSTILPAKHCSKMRRRFRTEGPQLAIVLLGPLPQHALNKRINTWVNKNENGVNYVWYLR